MSNNHRLLLVVEDNDEDFASLMRVLDQVSFSGSIHRCYDGDDALDFLHHGGQYDDLHEFSRPNLILLDLNLPGIDGKQVLQEIKQDRHLKLIPVIIFTTSSNSQDVDICYQAGVNSYILKPMNLDTFKASIKTLLQYWFEFVILPN
jgi:CheY-like chemotaxis protein